MLAACVSPECSEDSRTNASSYFSSAASSGTSPLLLVELVLARNHDDVLDFDATLSLFCCCAQTPVVVLQSVVDEECLPLWFSQKTSA